MSRIGLALAGGGPLGAVYEIGALVALEESISGLDLNALDGYVGVSAGSFLAAGLANGMTARQLCTAFIDGDSRHPDHVPASMFTRPALGEFSGRLAALPGLAGRHGGAPQRRPVCGVRPLPAPAQPAVPATGQPGLTHCGAV